MQRVTAYFLSLESQNRLAVTSKNVKFQSEIACFAIAACMILLPGVDCTKAGKDTRVLWNPEIEALKPFQGPMWVAHHVIHSSYLHAHIHNSQPMLLIVKGHGCK